MGTATKSTTVLLVDDDRQEYLLIGFLLSEVQSEDYRLIWCKNHDEALINIEQNKCDVVLLDYNRGDSSVGRDFLSSANSKNNRIPIIVMTDKMDVDVDQRAIREGASDYLTKSRINSQLLERSLRYAIERKQIEERLDTLAHYDQLTNLPNRSLFLDRLRQSMNLSQRDKKQFTLLFIDLDDFKGINDNYGHHTGDALLKEFSNRLQQSIRKSDTVARIGGDEFTVILNNLGHTQKIVTLVDKIISDANEPYTINDHHFNVNCSIGIAVYPESGTDEETLQRNADLAMYQAKQYSSSSYRFYNKTLTDDIKIQWDLLRDFSNAIKQNQLGVFYIPRIDLLTKKIVAAEIAPYWKHPKRGVLHYQHFSSITKDNEMYSQLSDWLLNVGLYHLKKLQSLNDFKLIFNFESHYVSNTQFIQKLSHFLSKYHLNGNQIELDLNQIFIENNLDIIETCMESLHDHGVNFGLNGFGSELSSLIHLQKLPINSLKLDNRFIKNLHRDANDARLCKAIIDFSHGIDKTIIADGVNKPLQLSMLKKLKCNQAKGPAVMGILSFKQLQEKLLKQSRKALTS